MDSVLRPYDLGSTQWYVLYQLANDGPTRQRELVRLLEIERATLSVIVSALVRKGLVHQEPDPDDQRQRVLSLLPAGRELWDQLPDPMALIRATAFDGVEPAELETVARVLQTATQRLKDLLSKGTDT
jgi:DNA-binding MarR family transcriptional regulator